jgi:hypothetical protein
MRAGRLLAAALLALTPSCSTVLVRPVVDKKAADGSVQPTCFTNSYAWPTLDAVTAALFVVLPVLALRAQKDECDATGNCMSTDNRVLLWGIGAPIWGASAYAGFSGARRCRAAGSTSRWRSWMYDPPPNGSPDRTPWHITPTR